MENSNKDQKGFSFDHMTTVLEDFFHNNIEHLSKQKEQLLKEIYAPLNNSAIEKKRKSDVSSLLLSCANIALDQIEETCSTRSMESWLSIIRRFPSSFDSWFPRPSKAWINYATLAIIKWSNWQEDTTLGQVNNEQSFGVALYYTDEIICDCFKVATLSGILDNIIGLNRWIGKGAKLKIIQNTSPLLEIPENVGTAVGHYERRRPDKFIFQDEGIPVNLSVPLKGKDCFICLSGVKKTLPLIFPKNNMTLFLNNNIISPLGIKPVLSALAAYEGAILDEFHSSPSSIIQTLYSISRRIIETIPPLKFSDHEFNLVCDEDINNQEINHRVHFFFSLCQRGYIRMPEEVLRQRLCIYPYNIEYSEADVQKLVNEFFEGFLLTKSMREKIDVLSLEPCPLIYTSPGGNCYFDLVMFYDFIRGLLVKGREWFSTQHGDRFTLAIKSLIEQKSKGVEILARKKHFTSPIGEKTEVDLLIKKGNVLYAVECKAYSKSRKYWLGNPDAVSKRSNKIHNTVKQVKRTTRIISTCSAKRNVLPEHSYIDWIVCMPSQEFIKPLNKYGMLMENIPKICTPEELVIFLNNA